MEHTGGEFAYHELISVGFLQSSRQQLGLYRTVVDEKGLHTPAGPGIRGLCDIACQAVIFPTALHGNHFGKVPAVNAVDRGLKPAVARGCQNLLSVPEELERHLRMGQCLHFHSGSDPGALHGVGFHELHPGGGVEEQVPNDDGGAVGAPGLALTENLPGLQVKAGAGERPGGFGQQIDAADGGNGGQSFPPEAHGADGCQVFGGLQLGSGVAAEGNGSVFGSHAAAVVRNPEKGHAAVPDFHGDLGSACIHGVFQELLHHGGRPLHHFACGNEVCNMGRKFQNFRHKLTSVFGYLQN